MHARGPRRRGRRQSAPGAGSCPSLRSYEPAAAVVQTQTPLLRTRPPAPKYCLICTVAWPWFGAPPRPGSGRAAPVCATTTGGQEARRNGVACLAEVWGAARASQVATGGQSRVQVQPRISLFPLSICWWFVHHLYNDDDIFKTRR
jgi:hypothetical protein